MQINYIGRRTTLKGENYTKIHVFNDASANEKTVAKSKRKTRKARVFKAFRAWCGRRDFFACGQSLSAALTAV